MVVITNKIRRQKVRMKIRRYEYEYEYDYEGPDVLESSRMSKRWADQRTAVCVVVCGETTDPIYNTPPT